MTRFDGLAFKPTKLKCSVRSCLQGCSFSLHENYQHQARPICLHIFHLRRACVIFCFVWQYGKAGKVCGEDAGTWADLSQSGDTASSQSYNETFFLLESQLVHSLSMWITLRVCFENAMKQQFQVDPQQAEDDVLDMSYVVFWTVTVRPNYLESELLQWARMTHLVSTYTAVWLKIECGVPCHLLNNCGSLFLFVFFHTMEPTTVRDLEGIQHLDSLMEKNCLSVCCFSPGSFSFSSWMAGG